MAGCLVGHWVELMVEMKAQMLVDQKVGWKAEMLDE